MRATPAPRRRRPARRRRPRGAGPRPAVVSTSRGGEILGVAGVDGNGQIELVETLAGLRRARGGAISLDGRDITRAAVAARTRAGLAYMPADRASTALVKGLSIAENLMLRDSRRAPYSRGLLLSRAARERKARDPDARIRHPCARSGDAAARLSGGNQQKIVVARELDRKPAVLIAHQAAWGLDPGATRFVRRARAGAARRRRGRSSTSPPNSMRCSTSPTVSP